MKEIERMHRQLDSINAALALSSARNGKPITCQGKGCCACCYEPVYCSSAEVSHLLETLTEEQKALVKRKVEVSLFVINASGLFSVKMPAVMDWLAMELPCPLLEGGLCTVYDRRPTSCRSHMASGPADWCKYQRQKQIYPQALEASVAQGYAILNAHQKLGNEIINDNLIALLANELLPEHHETSSRNHIMIDV